MYPNPDITYFARVFFRNQRNLFGIKQQDRLMHTYILGKTGTGKSTLLQTMLMQDIYHGRGCCLLDPHGDLVEEIERQLPPERRKDLVYFNVPDAGLNLRYNPLKRVPLEKRSLVTAGILEAFSKLWDKAWGVKLEHILRNAILALLDQPHATIEDIPNILLDKKYRMEALKHVQNENVKAFWVREFPRYQRFDLLPVLNKVGGMLAHPTIKRILVTNEHEVSFRRIMDDGKILLVNLSKGHVGADVAHILGALFLTSIASASFSRVDTEEEKRRPFMLYVDEFHNFTTLSLVNMFAELRKFKVGMTLAHQYLHQLEDDIKHAVLGNIGTFISFRVGAEDASYIAREMLPIFDMEDLINLANRHIYLKMMIDGKPSRPFSATTITYGNLQNRKKKMNS